MRTCLYTLQQNGTAERLNRAILDMVRCMLKEKQVHIQFWAEAAVISASRLNRLCSSAVRSGKTRSKLGMDALQTSLIFESLVPNAGIKFHPVLLEIYTQNAMKQFP